MIQVLKICSLTMFLALVLACLTYGSVRAGSTLELDLDRCVEMAVEVNTAVLKANYELDRARNGMWAAGSPIIPNLRLRLNRTTYETEAIRPVGDRLVLSDKAYTSSISIDEFVDFGTIMALFESSAAKHSTENYVVSVRQEVAYVAKGLYLNVLKAERLLGVREEALEASQRRLEKAQAMVDVGSAVRSDVLKAQVELSSDELELISARNALRLAETDLRYFLGVEDDIDLSLDANIDPGRVDYDLDGAIAAAMDYRPDIMSSEENLKSVKHGVWRERGGWFPWFGIGYSRNYYSAELPEGLTGVWDEAEWTWYMAAGIDLFDGLRTFTSVRDAKYRRSSAERDLIQLRMDVALEVKRAYYGVEEAEQRVKISEETVQVAEEELRLAEERYRLGGATMLEQIDSSVALSEARKSHIEAMYDYLLSQAQLERAIGKE
jgi:outer membrane protein TolC